MSDPVNLVDQSGKVLSVPPEQVDQYVSLGYVPETPEATAARTVQESDVEQASGLGGAIKATGAGALRGLSLGASDVALRALGGEDTVRQLNALRAAHPGLSTAGNIAGVIAPVVLTGGAGLGARAAGEAAAAGIGERLLAATPAGLASRLGAKIAGEGAGASLLGKTLATAAGGATEGALQNAGAYVSDVALGDRDLSADGFTAAMGQGAFWGGAAAGALTLGERGLVAAKRLFPSQEVAKAAVAKAEGEAVQEIATAAQESKTLVQASRDRIAQMREEIVANDLALKRELADIAAKKAREVATAETEAAVAKSAAQKAKAEAATARAEASKARSVRGKSGKIADEVGEPVAPAVESAGTAARRDVVEAAVEAPESALERQLAATKSALDSGADLGTLSRRALPDAIEAAQNAAVAAKVPEFAELVEATQRAEQSATSLDSWLSKYPSSRVRALSRAQEMRGTAPGYYTEVPAGEGTVGLPRGRQSVFRGTEEQELAVSQRAIDKYVAEPTLAERIVSGESAPVVRGSGEGAVTADEILDVSRAQLRDRGLPDTIDERIESALRAKTKDWGGDLVESSDAISNFERAHADLAEKMGDAAPPATQARAQALREAEQKSTSAATQSSVDHVEGAAKAADMISLGRAKLPAAKQAGGTIERIKDAGAALEALRAMGLPVPDPKHIPVVGPLLSLYLKARVLSKVARRIGGETTSTAESTIASKAAATRQRTLQAVDKMLDASAKGLRAATPAAPGVATTLGHQLFDGGDKRARPKSDDLVGLYEARTAELTAAMQPDAIRTAVRERIKASDPTIVDAIVASQERKLQYYEDKRPKPSAPAGLLSGGLGRPYTPARAELSAWARIIEAGENPAGVIERISKGGLATPEASDAIQTIYPSLFAEAQRRCVERAAESEDPIPYARRVQLSVLFGLPLESSMDPAYADFLSRGGGAPVQSSPSSPSPSIGQPTIHSDINIGARSAPQAEQGA